MEASINPSHLRKMGKRPGGHIFRLGAVEYKVDTDLNAAITVVSSHLGSKPTTEVVNSAKI